MTVRQAVVVIHGIGEQRPLDTLRGFVKALAGEKQFRNKPDAMSRLFELRRLQVPGDRHTPLTDFYEYYWAYRMRDTRVNMVWRWLRSLLLRKPRRIPRPLLPIYVLSWLLVIIAGLTVAMGGLQAPTPGPLAALVGSLFVGYATAFLYTYVGDAARYLDPHPDNIEQRNKIREEGIALLHSLHESKKYSRIIVVGHSLGSVIGYDLIRLYWSSVKPPAPETPSQIDTLRGFSEACDGIFHDETISEGEKVERYHQLQFRLWQELREKDMWPWLITDFITMGSPLTHARLLLARSDEDFDARKADGELVTCPPDLRPASTWYSRQYKTALGLRNADTPTHMVPFACTRWTNLFFPYRWVILGDMIGGPLGGNFGSGIRDIPVALKGLAGTLASHVCYWIDPNRKGPPSGGKHPTQALKTALRLDCLHRGVRLPPP
ncbi:hypothetical protein [Methylomicrobium lacus]|uniref:hypothetical protein n=1 Tax=Methylomicrobium lacus TaxID=136992 RepID=UPI0035A99FBE